MDKLIDTIKVTNEIDIHLYEAEDPREGSYISIKHKPAPRDMPGEVFIAPAKAPELAKALMTAAIELTRRGAYIEGYIDGENQLSPDQIDPVEEYFNSDAGQKEVIKARQNRKGHTAGKQKAKTQ